MWYRNTIGKKMNKKKNGIRIRMMIREKKIERNNRMNIVEERKRKKKEW